MQARLKNIYALFVLIFVHVVTSCSPKGGSSSNDIQAIVEQQVPDAVKDLKFTYKIQSNGKYEAVLTWTQSASVKSYTIKRGIVSKNYTETYTDTKSPFVIKNLEPGSTQYFVISLTVTHNNADVTVTSEEYSVKIPTRTVTDTDKPGAFGNVTATAGDAQVTLKWDASTKAKKYTIKRIAGGDVKSFETTETSYVDSTVSNGTTYTYSITAVNDNGQTDADASVTASPVHPRSIPGVFTLTASPGDNSAIITWTDSTDVTSYALKRGDSSGNYNKTDFVITTSPFVDDTVVPGQTYYYIMVATNSLGSTSSAESSTTPRICTPGDITLTSDSDVTEFNNTGCVTLVGNMDADGTGIANVLFTNLEKVTGHIYFNADSSLTSISFPKLKTVTEYAEFYSNYSLTTLDFPSLETVGDFDSQSGDFDSYDNTALTSINVPKLISTGNYFETWDDYALTTLNISSLQKTGTHLWIGGDNSGGYPVASIDLSSLQSTGEDFWFENLTNITTLSAPKLTTVGSTSKFIIRSNPALQSVSLPLLQNSGNQDIKNNPSLTSIDFSSMTSAASYQVYDNATLPLCVAVYPLYQNPIIVSGITKITGNNDTGDCGRAPLKFTFNDPDLNITSIGLSWNASFGASSYELRRGDSAGAVTNLIYSGSGTSYTDTGLTTGNTYFYKVTAINSNGSTDSNEISAVPTQLFKILQMTSVDTTLFGLGKSIFYDNSNVFLHGYFGRHTSGPQDAFLMKFDDVGALQTQLDYNTSEPYLTSYNYSAMIRDTSGNIFIASTYPGAGSATSVCTGGTGHNSFIIKYNSSGSQLWCHDFDSNGSIFGFASDAHNNIYTITNNNDNGSLTKFDNNGTQLWNVDITGPTGPFSIHEGLVVLGNSIYFGGQGDITGSTGYTGSFTPGGSAGKSFIAKYSTADGLYQAYTKFGAFNTLVYSTALRTDGTNVYISGYTYYDLRGGYWSVIDNDAYIVKFSSDLATTYWINQQHVDNEQTEFLDFAVDASGNAYGVGFTSAYDGGAPGLNGNTFKSGTDDGEDFILVKIDSSGNTVWTQEFGSTDFIGGATSSYNEALGVWTDGTTIFVTGYTSGAQLGTNANSTYSTSSTRADIFISKHSAATGNLQ